MVTIDAAGCQTAIVQALRAGGADYLLAVKRNQGTLHREVKAAFDEAEQGTFAPEVQDACETVERNGGRRERRTCTVLGGPGLCEWVADPEAWPGLRSLIRVQAERTGPRGRRQRSVRYYISSRPVDAQALLDLVRGHWGVENGLHRTLDVQFREDDCRMRTGHAHGACPRRDGHSAPGRTEHAAHTSAAFQQGCVHRAVARPHRTPTLDSGRRPALNPTLRLPCGLSTFQAAGMARGRNRAGPTDLNLASSLPVASGDSARLSW